MTDSDLIPLRAINAHVFCPRLMWLEYVDQEFVDNHHTIEGSHVHRNVDDPGGAMEAPQGEGCWHTRSLWLSSEDLGVTGKIDLVEEEDDGAVFPVDTKKGRPTSDGTLWPPDRVQLVLQALLLREHGYTCETIAAWYHGARQRVVEPMDDALVQEAHEAIRAARENYEAVVPPAPLVDSPKCGGCSLAPVCLPDETNALQAACDEPTRVLVPRENRLPMYLSEAGSKVGLKKRVLKIRPRPGSDSETVEIGLDTISQLNLMGGVQITTQALQACMRRDIPVSLYSFGGYYYGRVHSTSSNKVRVRIAQFSSRGSERQLQIARTLVADKIHNGRVLLRRNRDESLDGTLKDLNRIRNSAQIATSVESLLGYEGEGARRYWGAFSKLLSSVDAAWTMKGRSKRPPQDPTNALLSYGYALLVKDCHLAVEAAGLDAYLGVYHTAHHGRPSMALDLMEPFRRLVVDSVVFQMIKRREVSPDDFRYTGQAVAMKKSARKALIAAYERRMSEEITHPVFGYTISYRRIINVQARLLGRTLTQEIDEFPQFRTR